MKAHVTLLLLVATLSCQGTWLRPITAIESQLRENPRNSGRSISEVAKESITPTSNVVHRIFRKKKNDLSIDGAYRKFCSYVPKKGCRTEKQIQSAFPWIKKPKAVRTGQQVACDGRLRLADLDDVVDKIKLPRDKNSLVPRATGKRRGGGYKLRLDQKWKGVNVYGSGIVVEQEDSGLILEDSIDGTYVSDIENNIESPDPVISEKNAIEMARKAHGDTHRKIRNTECSLTIVVVQGKPTLSYLINYLVDQPAKVLVNTNYERKRPRKHGRKNRQRASHSWGKRSVLEESISNDATEEDLVNLFEDNDMELPLEITRTYVTSPSVANQTMETVPEEMREAVRLAESMSLKRPFTFLDANNGTIYRTWDGLAHARYAKQNLLAGNPSSNISTYSMFVETDSSKTTCYYQFPLQRDVFLRLNDRADAQRTTKKSFTCSSAQTQEYDAKNGEMSPRNSAYIWTFYSLLFFKTLGFRPAKNVNVEVHHDGLHAFWTGSSLELGDGTSIIYPMTAPDIVSHEVAHMVTESYSKLEYSGQSGAINEAFSDMTAVAFLNHQFNVQDFTLGHLVVRGKIPLRDLCNPNSPLTLSYNTDFPARGHASEWRTTDGVHQASGIYNKAFCLLSKTNGWTINLAFRVFFDANRYYWGPQETFNNGACGVRKAANDWFGGSTQALEDVDNAFKQVGVVCSEA